ncbi:MAG: bacterioferritin [Cyanobacteria bacterium HKST-UBA06]|nr:bacterioferritin [Cyanobacteria bacterium HKST-UBA05]MCA9798977.1 bacterioferritin [Cyanobacteria bacterium HKST-UBA04]MCA9807616.1 bacterioferritin [Cyanobacteria bacterium HKST-UBA06]MCA9841214.1 bacterioferritin [Cyanobacteria bacterium HKST-UBA03]
MTPYQFDIDAVVSVLNRILQAEISGILRYTHYSFMVFGPDRIPIITWLREQAAESLLHAHQVGELITHLGAHPTLNVTPLKESHKHDTMSILKESLAHEVEALNLYRELLELVKDKSIMIEEFARSQICEEEKHTGEVEKMIGNPGLVASGESCC